MTTFSIIVPVYNVEKYLSQCIDSILAQTFKDFELLLVDDGSSDSSPLICDEYAAKDNRIKVFHKNNGGVSSARNLGIEHSIGKWLYFVDADDELTTDCLGTFFSCINQGDYDMVMAGNKRLDKEGKLLDPIPPEVSYEISTDEALWLMYERKFFYSETYLWDKVFRRETIISSKLSFNTNLPIKEDCLFIVQLLCCSSKSVYYTTHIVYSYKRNDESVMSKLRAQYSPKQISIFRAHMLQIAAIRKANKNKAIYRRAVKGAYLSICNIESSMKRNLCYESNVIRNLKLELKKDVGACDYYSVMISNKFCNVKRKITKIISI